MKCHKSMPLSEEEIDDRASELYAEGKLTELAEFALRYDVDPHWTTNAAALAQTLSALDVPEALLRKYLDLIYENCELTVVGNIFVLSENTIILDIQISQKHLTEGGRICEAMCDTQVAILDALTIEERRLLSSVQFCLNVEGYSDDDEEEDDDGDSMCEHDTSPCLCDECVREREERDGPDTSPMALAYKILH